MSHSHSIKVILEKFRLIKEQLDSIDTEVNSLPFGSTVRRHLYNYSEEIGGIVESCENIIEITGGKDD